MAAKRKQNPNQPELPIEGTPPAKAAAANIAADKNGTGETGKAKRAKDANGETHVLAENVALPAPARPFGPGKIELPLHGRVNRSFLDYATYVIRNRGIPN